MSTTDNEREVVVNMVYRGRTAAQRVAIVSLGVLLLGGCSSTDTPAHDTCASPTGPGVTHQGEISSDETWRAADNPHVVSFDLSVREAQLTLEPCVVVRVGGGYNITIGGTSEGPAGLVARGERERPIAVRPDDDTTHWGSLRLLTSGRVDLEHVTLSRGGEPSTSQNGGGALVVLGAGGPTLSRSVRAVSLTIEDSGGFGVNLQSFAAFSEDSNDLVIKGSGQQPSASSSLDTSYPIYIAPPAVQSIPVGSYTGNKIDEISIFDQSVVQIDETFHDRGVPYRMQTGFAMSPEKSEAEGGLITLTIEAGASLKFLATPGNVWLMKLGTSNGAAPENLWPVKLVADGSADKPIVLTSAAAAPAAGDWGGINWRAGPASGNLMRYVRIEYAGGDALTTGFGCGPGDNDAALIISNWRPDSAFVQNVTVSDSAGGGIVSGWQSDDNGPNLKEGNTFSNIGNGCDVSRWSNVSPPACPGDDSVADCL